MSLRILVAVLFVGGCSGRQPLPTTPPPHVAWVPEVRALLGHVEDDALADFDAELARVRAIARFELETEDPDHEGVLRLLRLHRFDVDDAVGRGEEAVRVARARAMASGDLLVGALMLAGRDAFETILWVAPELLVARPEPFDRFLRSAFPLAPDALCAVTTRGFFIDRMTYMLECEGLVDARLAGVWGALDPTLRALLRARGRIAPGDALTGPEAALLVDASFWGAQASLHLALQRGDAASAAHLARVLVVRDPDNVPARLVLALGREIATGVIAGDAGTVQWLVHLFGPAYLAHRLAWLYVHGEWPDCEVDHVNGNRSDNRISNLRLATPTQNRMNGARRRDNATGFRGVHFEPRRKKYVAQLKIGTQRKYLGQFDTAEAAHAAYLEAAKEFYGDFARSE